MGLVALETLAARTRLIGLDVGDRTIGLAVGATALALASPLETIRRTRFTADIRRLFALIDEHAVDGLVIGLPINMDGSEGRRCQSVRQFAANLLALRDLPVAFWDERLSTAAVTRAMIEADLSRRRRAAAVDKLAAAYILQGAFDRLRNIQTDNREESPMGREVRRIVTGHDENGKAVVIADGPTPNVFRPEHRPGVQINNIWRANESPTHLMSQEETVEGRIALEPPPHGSVCRVIEFPPEKDWIDSIDREAAHASFRQFGASHAADSSDNPPHPLMHRTETIDYAICLEGEIYLVLDDSEVLMTAGDVCVQRGTNHAWSNRSDAPCFMCFVLIDGTFDA